MKLRRRGLIFIAVCLIAIFVRSEFVLADMDSIHSKNGIACSGCHGKALPQKGDTVENDMCISCHESYEALANKTRPAQFPDRNPHQSHLGDIGCVVCHKAHKPGVVYCLYCHRNFTMKIAGDSEKFRTPSRRPL